MHATILLSNNYLAHVDVPAKLVRKERLELSRVSPLAPKASASTNFATFAAINRQLYRTRPDAPVLYADIRKWRTHWGYSHDPSCVAEKSMAGFFNVSQTKKGPMRAQALIIVVGRVGIEPTTR